MPLTHFNDQGRARMVDVSQKPKTQRVARAAGKVLMNAQTLELVRTGGVKKGDVLAVAQVAGIMAAKRTWELVPMCHPIQLTGVSYEPDGIAVEATTRCCGETGVEMEAMTAASVACLTIYDMCKANQRDMVLTDVRLLEKDGGKSGHFVREGAEGEAAAEPAPANAPQVATVAAVSVSERKGERKHPVDAIQLVVGSGIAGDAHAGNWHRQVSLLADESVQMMRESGFPDLAAGDFAENILTRGRPGAPGGDADWQEVPQRLRDPPQDGHVRHAHARHLLRGHARGHRARGGPDSRAGPGRGVDERAAPS